MERPTAGSLWLIPSPNAHFTPMTFDQGEFNFDAPGSEQGYRDWQAELDGRKRAFAERWGVILGEPVRVKLTDRDEPLVGVVHLLTEVVGRKLKREELVFSCAGRTFQHPEIESIVRIGDTLFP